MAALNALSSASLLGSLSALGLFIVLFAETPPAPARTARAGWTPA